MRKLIIALCVLGFGCGQEPDYTAGTLPVVVTPSTDTTAVEEVKSSSTDMTHYVTVDLVNFYPKEVEFYESGDDIVLKGEDVSIKIHHENGAYYYSDPFTAAIKRVEIKSTDGYWQVNKVRFYRTLPAKGPISLPKHK